MSLMLDQAFVDRLSSQLLRFKQLKRGTLWNFRCPICGDSETNQTRTRGYIYHEHGDDHLTFKCHNCGACMRFSTFIKTVDDSLYREYLFSRIGDTGVRRRATALDSVPESTLYPRQTTAVAQSVFTENLFTPVFNLPDDHYCVRFLAKRGIPRPKWKLFGFTPTFKKFTNGLKPEKFTEPLTSDYPALVIPLIRAGEVVGFQGRAFDDNGPRYITIMLDDNATRLFGVDDVDITRKFYVVEGPLDSVFLSNAMAVCGSDMSISDPNATFVLDSEPRNKQIVKKYEKLLNAGKKTCILPHEFSGMDINDMILDGYTPDEVEDLIDAHTYSGLKGLIELQKWKRC